MTEQRSDNSAQCLRLTREFGSGCSVVCLMSCKYSSHSSDSLRIDRSITFCMSATCSSSARRTTSPVGHERYASCGVWDGNSHYKTGRPRWRRLTVLAQAGVFQYDLEHLQGGLLVLFGQPAKTLADRLSVERPIRSRESLVRLAVLRQRSYVLGPQFLQFVFAQPAHECTLFSIHIRACALPYDDNTRVRRAAELRRGISRRSNRNPAADPTVMAAYPIIVDGPTETGGKLENFVSSVPDPNAYSAETTEVFRIRRSIRRRSIGRPNGERQTATRNRCP